MQDKFFQNSDLIILDSAAIGLLDADFNMIFLNGPLAALFQAAPEGLKGLGYQRYLPGPDLELWRNGLAQAGLQGPECRWCFKTSLARPEGQPMEVRVIIDPLNGETGRPGRFLTVWETTETNLASLRQLRQAVDNYRIFFDHLPVPAFHLPLHYGAPVTVNQALADLLGYASPAEAQAALRGGRVARHFGAAAIKNLLDRLKRDQHLLAYPLKCRRLDGGVFDGALTVSVILDAQGERHSLDGYLEDVTLEKQTQLALTQAKEAAESADRAKSDFLANISHELRTPLNIIIGMSGMVLENPQLTPDLAEGVTMINQAGEELLGRINDLIAVGDLRAGRIKPSIAPFTVPALLSASLGPVEQWAKDEGVELVTESDVDQNLILLADHKLINTALTKLAHNAVKFSTQGQVKIAATLKEREEAPGQALLTIAVNDSGLGLPEGNQDDLFQGFSQGDGSSTRPYGGLGVGLYLARGLAELMGGRLKARNRPEGGAEFTLSLPVSIFNDEHELDGL